MKFFLIPLILQDGARTCYIEWFLTHSTHKAIYSAAVSNQQRIVLPDFGEREEPCVWVSTALTVLLVLGGTAWKFFPLSSSYKILSLKRFIEFWNCKMSIFFSKSSYYSFFVLFTVFLGKQRNQTDLSFSFYTGEDSQIRFHSALNRLPLNIYKNRANIKK